MNNNEMSNEMAALILKTRLNTYYCTDDDLKALDRAIYVLENYPKLNFEALKRDLPELFKPEFDGGYLIGD